MSVGATRPFLKAFFWMLGKGAFGSPDDLSDGLAELEAEDRFDFGERLSEIDVPTLVIGGGLDRLYPLRETAAGIPSAKLILYEKAGHMGVMRGRFSQDVLDFLKDGDG
jgi:pimeloyl-ACP methyl ester carboxylesterase